MVSAAAMDKTEGGPFALPPPLAPTPTPLPPLRMNHSWCTPGPRMRVPSKVWAMIGLGVGPLLVRGGAAVRVSRPQRAASAPKWRDVLNCKGMVGRHTPGWWACVCRPLAWGG